jgi:hypothetical protein
MEWFRNTLVALVSILDRAGDKDHRQLRVDFQNIIGDFEARSGTSEGRD